MTILSLLLVYTSLTTGTFVAVASTSWLYIWIGLEINAIAMLPLLIEKHEVRRTEACTKYFMAQAAGSTVMLFATITNASLAGQWHISQLESPEAVALVIVAIAMKLGLTPVHTWVPEVMGGISLWNCLLLSTWQKIAPLFILLNLPSTCNELYIFLGLASIFVAGWAGLNQNKIRKMLAYSSIAHMGWIILAAAYSTTYACLVFIIYCITTIGLFLITINLDVKMHLTASVKLRMFPMMAMFTILMLLSLAGLPPFTGFMSKFLVLEKITTDGFPVLAIVAGMGSLLSVYFYMHLAFIIGFLNTPSIVLSTSAWRFKKNKIFQVYLLTLSTSLSMFLIPFTPSILAFVKALIGED